MSGAFAVMHNLRAIIKPKERFLVCDLLSFFMVKLAKTVYFSNS
jgi:hypothetical protein